MADTATAVAALPVGPAQPRRRELLIGTAFATGGVVMLIATLVGAYLSARTGVGAARWLLNNNIPLTQPNMMLLTMAMSAVTMQWAVYSINRDDRTHTYLALGVTLLFGFAFINQTSFLYNQAAVTIQQQEGPLFYAVTGSHLAMVGAAMVFMVLMAFRALGGQFSSRQPDGISAVAIFWQATVARLCRDLVLRLRAEVS